MTTLKPSGFLTRIMHFTAAVLAWGLFTIPTGLEAQTINGAGASFPYPLYSQWAFEYNNLTAVKINYQSIGSGGGIAQIKARTVDFGATDAPLTKAELDSVGLFQFPMVVGGVTPVINLNGVATGTLKLSPELLAGIYLGEITKWNDPAIVKLNPSLKLPNLAVTVVHRSDGSGTSWIFTNYLDAVSPGWHTKVGTGNAVQWPIGIGCKGNEGVAANVMQVNGSIGYVEYAYALQSKLNFTQIQNKEGMFVSPTLQAFQSAAASADWAHAPGYYMVLTNQPGKETWPIVGATFILIYKQQQDPVPAKTMMSFFDWCFRHGGETAQKLAYVPLPSQVFDLVEKSWSDQVTSKAGAAIWK